VTFRDKDYLIISIALIALALGVAIAARLLGPEAPPVLATGAVSPLGLEWTRVCVHRGIAPLGPCDFPFVEEPLRTLEVHGDGSFTLRLPEDSLNDVLVGVDMDAAMTVDDNQRYSDGAIAGARSEIERGKELVLENRFREIFVATIIATRNDADPQRTFLSDIHCARKIVVANWDGSSWVDLSGQPIKLLLEPHTECWRDTLP
jgi:hypothetical protein